MEKERRTTCIYCERHELDVGGLSRRGLCLDCATRRQIEQWTAFRAGPSPAYKRHLDQQLRAALARTRNTRARLRRLRATNPELF